MNTWLDQDGNWTNNANWSNGAPPASGESWQIVKGNKVINTNVDQSAILNSNGYVGGNFAGKLGVPGSPFKLGSGAKLVWDTPMAGLVYQPSSASETQVLQSGRSLDSVILLGSHTDLIMTRPGGVTLDSATISTLHLLSQAAQIATHLMVLSGCSITEALLFAGRITSQASLGTVRLLGPTTLIQEGDATADITLLELANANANFFWDALTGTITDFKLYAGTIDGSRSAAARTVTNGTVYPTGTLILPNRNGEITFTNPVVNYGGRIVGNVSVSTKTVLAGQVEAQPI